MEKEMQQKFFELQMMDQQIKQIQKNIEMIETQIIELEAINQSLGELGEVKSGTEILVPVAGGVFAKAELKDNKNLVINVGAGTSVKKSIPETQNMIKSQIDEIANTRDEMLLELQKFVKKAQDLQKDMQKMQKEKK